jgi:transcriptional regulator with XRE-family HTH domain
LEIEIKKAYLTIGKNVADCRNKKGITQLELSMCMGYKSVSIVSMSEVVARNKHFNIEHLLKISKILDVEIQQLFKDVKI